MIKTAITDKTRQAYESGYRSVLRFVDASLTPLNTEDCFKDPLFWAMYICYQSDRKLAPGTVRHYISACQTLFAEAGEDIQPLRWPLVRRAMKEFMNKWKSPPKLIKQPVTVAVLLQVRPAFKLDVYEDRVT